jgi:hypothetical protein
MMRATAAVLLLSVALAVAADPLDLVEATGALAARASST